jgi:spore maturation protein CgeB
LPGRRFVVAGPQYPSSLAWPANVERIQHMPPDHHPQFYNAQRFTLNLTRAEMVAAGWSPSVRLFEAAACGVPIIGDEWPGLGEFFHAGSEILIAVDSQHAVSIVMDMPEEERRGIGEAARRRVLASHTAACRAKELEDHLLQIRRPAESSRPATPPTTHNIDSAGSMRPARIHRIALPRAPRGRRA